MFLNSFGASFSYEDLSSFLWIDRSLKIKIRDENVLKLSVAKNLLFSYPYGLIDVIKDRFGRVQCSFNWFSIATFAAFV